MNGTLKILRENWVIVVFVISIVFHAAYITYAVNDLKVITARHIVNGNHLDEYDKALLEAVKKREFAFSQEEKIDWIKWRKEIDTRLDFYVKEGYIRSPEATLKLLRDAVNQMLRELEQRRYRGAKKDST